MPRSPLSAKPSGPLRRLLAIAATRLIRRMVGFAGHDGTSLPGMIAARIDPTLVSALSADLGRVVVVVGTNGKTTTSRLTARILEGIEGAPPLANRSGANLPQALASTLLAAASSTGRLRQPGQSAVFEVDELAFDRVVDQIVPTVVIILNLFRDQMDRYGEVDKVVERWRSALARLPRTTILASCADDPRVEELVAGSGLPVVRFGFGAEPQPSCLPAAGAGPTIDRACGGAVRAELDPPAAIDAVACPVCGATLRSAWHSIGHLGDWFCPDGHVRRLSPDVTAAGGPAGDSAQGSVTFQGTFGRMTAQVHLAGASGAYDAAAALAGSMALGIEPTLAIRALDGATPAFARLEEAKVGRRRVVLALVKNPASMTESTEAAAALAPDGVLLGLSDEPADGRDVSWIWDVDMARFAAVPVVGVTGTRRGDMALRLKYAVRGGAAPWPIISRDGHAGRALAETLAAIPVNGTLVVLATYTSLLAIRAVLERSGAVSAIPR